MSTNAVSPLRQCMIDDMNASRDTDQSGLALMRRYAAAVAAPLCCAAR
jgi:hypothetical protein